MDLSTVGLLRFAAMPLLFLALLTGQVKSPTLQLHLTLSGGIGTSFDVDIAGNHCTYSESRFGGGGHTGFERTLQPAELAAVKAAITDLRLLRLESEDLKRHPLVPDQAFEVVQVSLGGPVHEITCSLPNGKITNPCQTQMRELIRRLNDLLRVKIF